MLKPVVLIIFFKGVTFLWDTLKYLYSLMNEKKKYISIKEFFLVKEIFFLIFHSNK